MSNTDMFNVVAGTASIVSLLISLWAALTARSARDKLEQLSLSGNTFKNGQNTIGTGNKVAGRDLHDESKE